MGEGWVVELSQLKIKPIVSFQKAKYTFLFSIPLVRGSYTLNLEKSVITILPKIINHYIVQSAAQ